ncbi:tetratricopeptide repeat protein [Pedobacter sp. BS3]|uniref:tetratricopeptide repeat protein n=1 Tax=Pedobacter sp. BS3 TaxID=2567937 RepID=UPI0011F02662|nr:tetratricopeptide repeat protein [Pedobacter sp. BS3]TZF84692.1 tetratricopeptide repeat protein [Pedobacter sp. BS3]
MQRNRLQKLLEFLESEPDDPFLKYALATEYLRLNETGQALAYYEDLVNKHHDYVGTYYHLGKLYEALNRKDDAIKTYREGMTVARAAHDNHAYAELQSVYNAAMGLDYEDD